MFDYLMFLSATPENCAAIYRLVENQARLLTARLELLNQNIGVCTRTKDGKVLNPVHI